MNKLLSPGNLITIGGASLSLIGLTAYFNNARSDYHWYTDFSGGFPTADWSFSANYKTNLPLDKNQWQNNKFEELLVLARKETNNEMRKKIYSELQEIYLLKGNEVIPSFYNFVGAYSKSLAHEKQIGNNFPLDDCRIPKRWWFI